MNPIQVSESNLIGLVFVVFFFGLMLLFVVLDLKRKRRYFREISAYTRLKRQIGLAVEAGKRLHISLGHGGIYGIPAGSVFVGLSILQRIARAASISDRPPIATSGEALEAVLSQDTLKAAYQQCGAENQYQHTSGQVTGLTPFSYIAGTITVINDQEVATNILSGSFGGEVALLTEVAERNGSKTIGGSDNIAAQAVLYATADEPLIGEELYAAGAYLKAGRIHVASLQAQDVFRWVLVLVIIVGAILELVGIV